MRTILLGLSCVLVACGPKAAPAQPTATTPTTPVTTAPPATGVVAPPTNNAKLSGMFNDDNCSEVKGGSDAVALFAKACTAQDAQGCFDLSLHYLCGAGVPHDDDQAGKYSEQACNLGNAAGCGNGATIYMVPGRDQVKAFQLATKGCALDNSISCSYIGVFYWQGVGVAADPVRAAKIFDEQCMRKNDLMACANYSVQFYMGQGVPRDLKRAKELGERSCAGHMPAGCNILAAALLEEGGDDNIERAAFLLTTVCDSGGGPSCDNLGQIYEHGAGKIHPDKDKARDAYKRACDLSNALGCTHLGELISGQ